MYVGPSVIPSAAAACRAPSIAFAICAVGCEQGAAREAPLGRRPRFVHDGCRERLRQRQLDDVVNPLGGHGSPELRRSGLTARRQRRLAALGAEQHIGVARAERLLGIAARHALLPAVVDHDCDHRESANREQTELQVGHGLI